MNAPDQERSHCADVLPVESDRSRYGEATACTTRTWPPRYSRWGVGKAGLSAKKPSSASAGVAPSSLSALSPRSLIKPIQPATRHDGEKAGSWPSARAILVTNAQANNSV